MDEASSSDNTVAIIAGVVGGVGGALLLGLLALGVLIVLVVLFKSPYCKKTVIPAAQPSNSGISTIASDNAYDYVVNPVRLPGRNRVGQAVAYNAGANSAVIVTESNEAYDITAAAGNSVHSANGAHNAILQNGDDVYEVVRDDESRGAIQTQNNCAYGVSVNEIDDDYYI